MDASHLHHHHHPQQQQQQQPHDQSRYLFQSAQFPVHHHLSQQAPPPTSDWSDPVLPPPAHPYLAGQPQEPPSKQPTRMTRNRTAAMSKDLNGTDALQQPPPPAQLNASQVYQAYNARFFGSEQADVDPANQYPHAHAHGHAHGAHGGGPAIYPYHAPFNAPGHAGSASPPEPQLAPSSSSSPSSRPQPANSATALPPPPMTPFYHVQAGTVPGYGAHQQHNPSATFVSGAVEGYAPQGDDPAATVYGSMSAGPEMRVPSASPSIASAELSSPPPGETTPSLDRAHPSSRSSSRPKSLDNYDYAPPSGPLSPLSASNYNQQPLPSSLSTITGGYLHDGHLAQPHPYAERDDDNMSKAMSSPTASVTTRGPRSSNQKSKTKLTDMDRKFICVFAINNPKARQEDIATKFAVERSTVSKILKSKEKWMKVDFFSSEARTVKHRPSKFPELEMTLIHQLRVRSAAREPINDSFIKKLALELADERGIGKDKFKASSGWVENFKHRHDLRKGSLWDKPPSVWSGASGSKSVASNSSSVEEGSPDVNHGGGYRDQHYPAQAPTAGGFLGVPPPTVGAQ